MFQVWGASQNSQLSLKDLEKSANVTTTMEADEQATFIFLTEHVNEEHEALVSTNEPVSDGPALTTAEVVEAGKAVIDGGATRSIGSTYALNRVLGVE